MLETIRELAAEKLAAEGETADLRRRHAEQYLEVARSSNLDAEALGPQRHDLVIPEQDNMRAALAWALESEERELGLELLVALENFWATNAPAEGVELAAALLGDGAGVPESLVVRALRVHGGMENQLGHTEAANEHWERAMAIARRLGEERAVAVLLHRMSHVAIARGDFDLTRKYAEESLAGHRRAAFPKGAAQALSSLAVVARVEGDLERALELLEESREIVDGIGFRWWHAGVLANIAGVTLELGRLDDAERNARQALSLSQAMRDRRAVVFELRLLAEISARAGNLQRAGMLWGVAEAEHERVPVGTWVHAQVELARIAARTDPEFEAGRAAGRELSLEDAIALALEGGEASLAPT